MKKVLFALLCALLLAAPAAMADGNGDQIVGNYTTLRNGVNSKIKIFKLSNGKYRAQVTWVDNLKKADGSVRTDERNKDKAKRSVRADQIVLIESIAYNEKDNCYEDGRVYDPTNGKTYKAKLWLEGKKLNVRGYLGPFYDTSVWTKQ